MVNVQIVSIRGFALILGRLAAQGNVVHTVFEKNPNIDVVLVTSKGVTKEYWVAHNKGIYG